MWSLIPLRGEHEKMVKEKNSFEFNFQIVKVIFLYRVPLNHTCSLWDSNYRILILPCFLKTWQFIKYFQQFCSYDILDCRRPLGLLLPFQPSLSLTLSIYSTLFLIPPFFLSLSLSIYLFIFHPVSFSLSFTHSLSFS